MCESAFVLKFCYLGQCWPDRRARFVLRRSFSRLQIHLVLERNIVKGD